MRPAAPLTACLLAATLAGCLGTDDGDPSSAESDPARFLPETHALTGCAGHEGFFDIPASQAEPYLPDGFELVGAGGDPLPEGAAVLLVKSLACEGRGNDTATLWVYLLVDPPAAYENEATAFHLVQVAGVTSSEPLAAAWAAWDVARMAVGDVRFEERGAPPLAADAETWADAGDGVIRVATTVAGPHRSASGGEARLFGVEEHLVTGIVDYVFTAYEGAFGQATLEHGGSLPFDVQGPGAAVHLHGLDETYRYVEPPATMEGAR